MEDPCAAVVEQTQIVIQDTRAFPGSLTSAADGTIIIGSIGHLAVRHLR